MNIVYIVYGVVIAAIIIAVIIDHIMQERWYASLKKNQEKQ